MKFLYGLAGANVPVIREFDIAPTEKFVKGQIVKCSPEGEVSGDVIGTCLGVAAENHSGKEEFLNERANGNKLRVDVTSDGVYAVDAPRLVAVKKCTATTFSCYADNLNDKLEGAKLVLVEKGENSSNTDFIGSVRTVSAVAFASTTMDFTINAGGIPDTGDVYALIPPTGFVGCVADDKCGFVCASSSTGTSLKVVGGNEKTACLEVVITGKTF